MSEERTEEDMKILKKLLLDIIGDWCIGGLKTIKFLVEKENIDLNYGENQTNPLHVAIEKRDSNIVKYLVEQGANPNIKNRNGKTAFQLALEKQGSYYTVRYLVEHGADLNEPDKDGNTPFHNVISHSELFDIKFWIEHGANINLPNKNGNTPLHLAIFRREDSKDVIEYLIQQGADLNAKNKDGSTPLELAIEEEKSEIAKYLLKISKQNK